jgi:2,3-dihydroxybenzoate-AMP ligase
MPVRPVQPSQAGMVPWPDEVAARYVAQGWWEGRTLGEHLAAAADASPDAAALVDGDMRLTFRELLTRADGAALRMRDLGLRPDDRIVVQLHNGWEFVVLTIACLRLGVIPVMALPAHRGHELRYLAGLAEARAIAVPGIWKGFDHEALAHSIAGSSGTLEHVLVAGSGVRPPGVDLRGLCAPAPDPAAARAWLDRAAPSSRAVALMLLSGGTTGLPKLIARTHDDYGCLVALGARVHQFGPGSVYLAVLPFGHNLTLYSILGVLRAGGRVVAAPSPAPETALAAIEAERVTATAAVPAIAARWLEYMRSAPGLDLGSLRTILVGGARLPDELAPQVGEVLGCTLQQGYGMAEGLVTLTRLDDPHTVTCHTQGRPICAGDELLVAGGQGGPAAPGEPGELLTRGPYTVRGYYRAPEHNARAFTPDGWYRTGDIVRVRPDGNLVVEGRVKDMINRGGENISAEEVENFAYQLDGVAMAAAVAMPDPVLGERVCLYVAPRTGAQVRLADVVGVMERAGVARFKQPERLILLNSLPTTSIGKIDKKALRADIAGRISGEQDAEDAA